MQVARWVHSASIQMEKETKERAGSERYSSEYNDFLSRRKAIHFTLLQIRNGESSVLFICVHPFA